MVESEPRHQSPSAAQGELMVDNGDQHGLKDMELIEAPALTSSEKQNDEQEDKYPPFTTVLLILLSLYLAMFLVALVRSLFVYPTIWETDDTRRTSR
jgi:hypothetical protein